MLHNNFQGNRLFGSGKEDVLMFFTIYGLGGHPMEVPHEIWLQSAQWFLRKRRLPEYVVNLSDLGPRSVNDLDL